MKRFGLIKIAAGIIALLFSAAYVHAQSNTPSWLQAIVLDDSGAVVQNAEIYLFSQDRDEFYGVHYSGSQTSLELSPGRYRAYAGLTQETHGIFDHYTSPEIQLTLRAGDNVSVILPLEKSIENEMVISDTTRAKLNIPTELAQYLN